jgi:hypothetical protein
MANIVRFKRGDTFSYRGALKSKSDPSKDWSGWTAAAQLRKDDIRQTLVQTFTVSAVGSNGEFTLVADSSATALWPIDIALRFDVEFVTPAGIKRSSKTITMVVEKDETR